MSRKRSNQLSYGPTSGGKLFYSAHANRGKPSHLALHTANSYTSRTMDSSGDALFSKGAMVLVTLNTPREKYWGSAGQGAVALPSGQLGADSGPLMLASVWM